MMISPESYYEEYLKGKTKEEIMTVICELKQEIAALKNIMEGPDYNLETLIHPSESTQIFVNREYLELAKEAYAEAGGIYILSKSEKRAANFDANINFISKIIFKIGSYFDGYPSYIVELSEELKAYKKMWDDEEPISLLDYDKDEIFTKDSFIVALRDLHIGEWLRQYSTLRFNYMVHDGTQWELEFEYKNGHKPVRFDGDNSYPYNFDKFLILFGINESDEL